MKAFRALAGARQEATVSANDWDSAPGRLPPPIRESALLTKPKNRKPICGFRKDAVCWRIVAW